MGCWGSWMIITSDYGSFPAKHQPDIRQDAYRGPVSLLKEAYEETESSTATRTATRMGTGVRIIFDS
jgi:hypothetical protein